jgi:hypothetical protein
MPYEQRGAAGMTKIVAITYGPAAAQEMGMVKPSISTPVLLAMALPERRRAARRELLTRPADLTRLSERNGGAFPYCGTFAVIDGRYIVTGHGDRVISVRGRQVLEEDTKIYGPHGGEIVTTERIHKLAGYTRRATRADHGC